MQTNVSPREQPEGKISQLLLRIGQPARIQILFVISAQEACVCHLEAVLGIRQASISQHLMVLRKARLVTAHRNGRNIFYRLARPEVIDILRQVALLAGCDLNALQALSIRPVPGCPCPDCNPDLDPNLSCKSIKRRLSS